LIQFVPLQFFYANILVSLAPALLMALPISMDSPEKNHRDYCQSGKARRRGSSLCGIGSVASGYGFGLNYVLRQILHISALSYQNGA
jgi:magnesium-transporting ATPase (P-type)